MPFLPCSFNSDARVVAQLPDREGVVIGDVTLDPARKRRPTVPRGYWSRPPARIPGLSGGFFVMMERRGKRAYAENPARVVAARAVMSASHDAAERDHETQTRPVSKPA
jgi:hypothetical protein